MFFLGRDVIRLHKVHKHANGPSDAPYAQKLNLGWVMVGNVCLGSVHNPLSVNTFSLEALEQDCPTIFKPCPSIVNVKERHGPKPSEFSVGRLRETLDGDDTFLGLTVFQLTDNDNKLGPSTDNLTFMAIMEHSLKKNDSNSWIAPLPFRLPRRRLSDNRPQTLLLSQTKP